MFKENKDVWCVLGTTAILATVVFTNIVRASHPTIKEPPIVPTTPLQGQSADEMVQLAKARALESFPTAAIPSDYHACTAQEIAGRWKRLQAQDNSLGRRIALAQARKKFASRTWPIIAQRGYIKNKKCWIVACWHLMRIGFCGNSMLTNKQATKIINDACTEVAIVEDDAPHRVLTYTLGDPRIGME